MIVIVGESASGKTTVENLLVQKNPHFKKIVTYTTRPKRMGEKDGEDYHFVSVEDFKQKENQGFFIESARYRGWSYGVAKEDCGKPNTIAVLTPAGLRTVVNAGFDVISFYIKVDRVTRLSSLLRRGDDIEEAYRRSLSDVGQFDGIENEVDYVIENQNYKMTASAIADEILDAMKFGCLSHKEQGDHIQEAATLVIGKKSPRRIYAYCGNCGMEYEIRRGSFKNGGLNYCMHCGCRFLENVVDESYFIKRR